MLDVQAESSKRLEEARRAAMRVFPFRLANVTIGANDGTLSPSFMTTVHSHVMSGVVTVGDVVLRSSDGRSLGDFDRQKFADFVTAVCAPLTPFVQFCSALTYSTGVEELVVDDILNVHHPMSRRQRWAMLLYAVFSAEASNDIQCLGLGDFEITEGDLAWMRALFEAHDPIKRLLLYALAEDPLPTDAETPSSRIDVRSGATIQPCQGFTPLFDVETRKELAFYSYRSCGSGMEVIAPAFGNTIVPGSHILRTEPIDGASHKWWNLDSHKIKSLYIRSYGDESDPEYEQCMRNLASFIGIIGRPLETLGLLCDLPRPEMFLSMVWPTCPNLKKLNMYDPTFQSLQYLVDAYESGECHIESLRLEEVRLSDASSLDVLAKTLADPTSKMARTLAELQFMLAEDSEIFAPTGQHCVALANALSTNETLQFLSINVQIDDYADVKPLYEKLHNSWIPGSTT